MLYNALSSLAFSFANLFGGAQGWMAAVKKDAKRWKNLPPLKDQCIWMHCASLGEFEMGKPVLEALRAQHPQYRIVVTFFSPSGFEPRKDYPDTEVYYLPLDTASTAKKWVAYINPAMAFFVRYDLWPNHISALRKAQVPVAVIAMTANSTPWYLSRFLPLMRSRYTRGVRCWGMISEQDAMNMSLAGVHSEVLGHPKWDYAQSLIGQPLSSRWVGLKDAQDKPVFILGSAHEADVEFVLALPNIHNYSVWVVPHSVDQESLAHFEKALHRKFNRVKRSSLCLDPVAVDALLVDEFGVLRQLYAHANKVFVGGGFGKATHNVLEATAAGKRAACGPNWKGMPENAALIEAGLLVACGNPDQCEQFLYDDDRGWSSDALDMVNEKAGATKVIADRLSTLLAEGV